MFFRWKPDLVAWHKEGRGVYVRHDGCAKVEKQGNRWVPFTRPTVDHAWVEAKGAYLALHAAQDHCRREEKKGV